MSHSAELIQTILALVQQDYPASQYSVTTERAIPGTRMYPDILILDAEGKMQCAVEIGYTRPEKLTAYRDDLKIPDVRWYDKAGNLHADVRERVVTVSIEVPAPQHRFGWTVRGPLVERGIFKEFALEELEREGIKQSRSYDAGFQHDNCSNTCIKAGKAQWAKTLHVNPSTFAYAEGEEQRAFVHIGRDDIGVLRDRSGGETKRISLTTFRERVQAGEKVDRFDWGGCGCAVDDTEASPELSLAIY